MLTPELDEAFVILESFDGHYCHLGPGVSESSIRRAEDELGVVFPVSFRSFLVRFGYGGVGGMDMFGLSEPDHADSVTSDDLVETNLRLRREIGLPTDVLVIEECGDGDYYALEVSGCAEGESPVVVWPIGGAEDRQAVEHVAPDFGEFLLIRVESVQQALIGRD